MKSISSHLYKNTLLFFLFLASFSSANATPTWQLDSQNNAIYLNSKIGSGIYKKEYLVIVRKKPNTEQIQLMFTVADIYGLSRDLITKIHNSKGIDNDLQLLIKYKTFADEEVEGIATVDNLSSDPSKRLLVTATLLSNKDAILLIDAISSKQSYLNLEIYVKSGEDVLPFMNILAEKSNHKTTYFLSNSDSQPTLFFEAPGFWERGKLLTFIDRKIKPIKMDVIKNKLQIQEHILNRIHSERINSLFYCWLQNEKLNIGDSKNDALKKAISLMSGESKISTTATANWEASKKVIAAFQKNDLSALVEMMIFPLKSGQLKSRFNGLSGIDEVFERDVIEDTKNSHYKCSSKEGSSGKRKFLAYEDLYFMYSMNPSMSRPQKWKYDSVAVGPIYIQNGFVVGVKGLKDISKPYASEILEDSKIGNLLK